MSKKSRAKAAAKAAAAVKPAAPAAPAAKEAPKPENKMTEGPRKREMSARAKGAGTRGPMMSRVRKGVQGLSRRRFI
jgi:hypothetical protein